MQSETADTLAQASEAVVLMATFLKRVRDEVREESR